MSLVVVRALGLVTIQDLGRPGRMHEGLAPGGALVPSLLLHANHLAGAAERDAAIEVCGQLVVRAECDVILAVAEAERARLLHAGESLTVESGRRRATYLAVRGGIEAPVVLGGRGAQLSAGVGQMLSAGDVLGVGATAAGSMPATTATAPPVLDDAHVDILPGPDLDAFEPDALATLVRQPYRISPTSDRIGTRLEGDRIAHVTGLRAVSRPMVRGAIEVPPDGAPIVLGPEHPTTGGYPVIAVVATASLDALFARALGGTVRFRAP